MYKKFIFLRINLYLPEDNTSIKHTEYLSGDVNIPEATSEEVFNILNLS